MDADQATARARAEARRAKILARQKDRLSTITGVYSKHGETTEGPDTCAPAPPSAQPTATPAAQAGAEPAVPVEARQQVGQVPQPVQDQSVNQEQLKMLMATLERQLQHAQAVATSPQLSAPHLEVLQQTLAAGTRPPSWGSSCDPVADHTASETGQGLAGAAAAAFPDASRTDVQPADQLQQQQQQPPLLLQLGPVLSRSVKQTQLFRLLAAMFLAYAALTGWHLGLPPVALLVVGDLAVVLAAAVVLPAKAAEGGAGGADVKVPWRMRSLDILSLVPGLRELMDSLAGYNAVATAISQDFAAFVVITGLLLTTDAVPAAVNWGLGF